MDSKDEIIYKNFIFKYCQYTTNLSLIHFQEDSIFVYRTHHETLYYKNNIKGVNNLFNNLITFHEFEYLKDSRIDENTISKETAIEQLITAMDNDPATYLEWLTKKIYYGSIRRR